MRRTLTTLFVVAVAVAALVPTAAAAEQRHKGRGEGGAVPDAWNLPKPRVPRHPDVAPWSASGLGDGFNPISFAYFDSGDIVVVTGTAAGHAGLFDRAYYTGLYSYAVWSANTSPRNGVQREPCVKFRSYDRAYALWVPRLDAFGSSARYYARAQNGEPYDIWSSKGDQSRWYCSTLPWAAWRYRAGVDLDGDGGYWVWPIDLVSSAHTSLFGFWD